MKGIFLKIVSALLCAVLFLAMLPQSALTQTLAAQGGLGENELPPMDLETIEFFRLANQLEQASKQDDPSQGQEYPGGYEITDLKVENGVAAVEYIAAEDATVIVALYSEDGSQLVLSGSAQVSSADTVAEVALGRNIPRYFQAAAFLVRTADLMPLCSAYKTSLYTQDMQKLLSSTVKSYPAEQVINLDDDNTTNFVVMREGVLQITGTDTANRFSSIDRVNHRYVIQNADASVTGLQAGDIFVYAPADKEWVITRVESVTVNGTTVTIRGSQPDMTDVFSHIKIEATGTAEDIEIDESALSDDVTYLGLIPTDPETREPVTQTYGINRSVENENSVALPLFWFAINLKVEAKAEVGGVETSVETEAEVLARLGIEITKNFYMVNAQSITEMEIKTGLMFDGSVEGKVAGSLPALGEWKWMPFPGVTIGFAPALGVELDGEVTLEADAAIVTKVYYDVDADCYRHTPPTPVVEGKLETEGTLFIGLDFHPEAEVLFGLLLDAELTTMVGLFFTGEVTGTDHGEHAEVPDDPDVAQPSQLHSCADCIEGDILSGAKLGLEVKLLGQSILGQSKHEVLSVSKMDDFYVCLNPLCGHDLCGVGSCPKRRFLITVETLDDKGNPIANALVKADGSASGLPVVEMGVTNENGVVSNYLPAGNYSFIVDGSSQKTETQKINGAGIVRIDGSDLFFAATEPASALKPILEKILDAGEVAASGTCGDNISWTLTYGGFLNITGTGELTEKPWKQSSIRLQVVCIGEGITAIGNSVFANESYIFNVTLPSTLKTIGEKAFYLTKIETLAIPEGVTAIGKDAFSGCTKMVSLTLPTTLTTLGESAFYNCKGLTTVILPRGLTAVPRYAFGYCSSLQEVSIPNTVTEIGSNAFSSTALVDVKLKDTITAIGSSAFYDCKALRSVTLPSGLTEIAASMFASCKNLQAITIPSPVTAIGHSSFEGCESLESVHLPDGVTTIGASAFRKCTGLTLVKPSAALTTIGDNAFDGCTNLSSVYIPASVTSLGAGVFRSCESLQSMTLPDGLTEVPSQLFSGCIALTEVRLPNTITKIGSSAFYNCGFTTFTVPSRVTVIGYNAFDSCSALTSIQLPSDLLEIQSNCFEDCTHLVECTLPAGVTTLGSGAFAGCSSLPRMDIPAGVRIIPEFLFNKCTSLAEVTMPQEITSIGKAAFQLCESLTAIDLPDPITAISSHTFYGSGLESIVIPEGVTMIDMSAFSQCESLKTVQLPSTLTSLGSDVFHSCSALESINIPEGVTEIPYCGFYNCYSLQEIDLPEGVTKISQSAFSGCSGLTSVTIPDTLEVFAYSCFDGCSDLLDIYIPYGVTTIGGFAFNGCDSLSYVIFPSTLSSLGSWSFAYCDNLGCAYFTGNAPSGSGWFLGNEMDVYYPAGDDTWTDEVMANAEWIDFVKSLNWISYTPTSVFSVHRPASDAASEEDPTFADEDGPEVSQPAELLTESPAADEDAPTAYGIFGGEYTEEEIDGTKVKTATFRDLLPNRPYLLLSVANIDAGQLLAPENILYVAQVTSNAAGIVAHSYVQRVDAELSFVMLCGASGDRITNATVTFPPMIANGQTQVVHPVVQYNGTVLEEGIDYLLEGDVSFTDEGTYTCTVRGIYQFTGKLVCSYSVLPASHVHVYDQQKAQSQYLAQNASCTAAAAYYTSCVCGAKGDSTFFHGNPTAHNYGTAVTAPTCTDKGYTTYTCSACGHSYTGNETAAKGHTMSNWETVKAATCTAAGEKARTCQNSGCNHKETQAIPAADHDYSSAVTAPTCTADGYTTYTCSACGHSYTGNKTAALGHSMSAWTVAKAATPAAKGEETRACSRCSHTETRELAYAGKVLAVSAKELLNPSSAWIDGVQCEVFQSGSTCYIALPEGKLTTMVSYSYNESAPKDIHTQYPTGMRVWRLTQNADGTYSATYVKELDNILQYSGSSIRITGTKGIRMITSIEKAKKTALTGSGLAGYKLVEYGTALCWAKDLEGGNPMVLGQKYVKSNYAYRRGVADPVFAQTDKLVQYTNVLVGFNLDQCKDDIAMRPYIILEDASGARITIYGGIVYRSIGYIAYQNRTVFSPGTASYNYVWEIIHHVYGKQFDKDYKG